MMGPGAGAAAGAGDPVPALWGRVLAQVRAHLEHCGAHPARTVVLVPFAQLMGEAARQWARLYPQGFAPRFETTRNWAAQLAQFVPGPHDLAQRRGRDLLSARGLLEAAGLGAQHALLSTPLLDCATQLAAVAASWPPPLRAEWGEAARRAVPIQADGWLAWEAAVARTAIAWVAHSEFATDVLFAERVRQDTDALVVLRGLQPDPLAERLLAHFGVEKALAVELGAAAAPGAARWHQAEDGASEAARAAACVLRQVEAGCVPVALVAGDRLLTRRIRALLDARVRVRDETGWKLSTTHAAAQVMALLRACAPQAGSDAVLDALKQCPDASAWRAADLPLLERELRRQALRRWQDAPRLALAARAAYGARLAELVAAVDAARAAMQAPRPIVAWLRALADLLRAAGRWDALQADAAGRELLQVLELAQPEAIAADAPALARRPLRLAEFSAWVDAVLESASFVPPHPAEAEVVITPLPQLLGRPFAAVVLPGADAVRLAAAPEPPRPFSNDQRAALGLPTREQLGLAQGAALAHALQAPQIDVLWRVQDDGEELQPSPMLQLRWLDLHRQDRAFLQPVPGEPQRHQPPLAVDPRVPRELPAAPVARPQPVGRELPLTQLSASGYEALRTCPYRFFALRQLGLAESPEIDVEVDKRDFGTWLHRLLHDFHTGLAHAPAADLAERRGRLDAAADAAARALALPDDEFLPFRTLWPALRDGYLDWLARHEADGARFAAGEVDRAVQLGAVTLRGRLDRIDRLADGRALVLDYKTERPERTRQRIAAGTEDTQLPFYAALLEDDELAAAYLSVPEREPARSFEPSDLMALRDALVEGIRHDLQAIAQGVPLPALGEGAACDWCEARGLCRKDFWNA